MSFLYGLGHASAVASIALGFLLVSFAPPQQPSHEDFSWSEAGLMWLTCIIHERACEGGR